MRAQTFLTLVSVLTTISMFALFITSAVTNYAVVRPLIVGITVEPSDVKLASLAFDFDALTSTYTNATVALTNEGPSDVAVDVAIHLVDINNSIIATGEATTPVIVANMTLQVLVPLSWVQGKTVNDFASGKVSIS